MARKSRQSSGDGKSDLGGDIPSPLIEVQELKHRLANAFQLVEAMIRLRLAQPKSDDARAELQWASGIVRTLAAVQGGVNDDAAQDSFWTYLAVATDGWRQIGRDLDVKIECNLGSRFRISQSQSRVLAIILHELVTNAFEHGFADGRAGLIIIGLHRVDTVCELRVRDDGRGLPVDGVRDGAAGLGIVAALAARLGGDFTLKPNPAGGADATVSFALDNPRRSLGADGTAQL